MNTLVTRAWRAALFDRRPFNDWLFDGSATADAALIVLGVTVVRLIVLAIAGLGAAILGSFIPAAIQALAGWILLGAATWFAGTRMFGGSGDWQTVIRLQGLAYLPNLLGVFAVFVGVTAGSVLGLVGYVWYLAAAAIGTGVALSLELKNAALSVLTGAAILFVIDLILNTAFSGLSGAFETASRAFVG